MVYDSRADLVTRLEAIRTEISNARKASAVGISDKSITYQHLKELREEEKDILAQINVIDARSSGGPFNKVRFGRPI